MFRIWQHPWRKTVCDVLLSKFFSAAEHWGYDRIALAGGVAANSELRRRAQEECVRRGYAFYMPDLALCGDNAAMIGVQGIYELRAGHTAGQNLNAAATASISGEN